MKLQKVEKLDKNVISSFKIYKEISEDGNYKSILKAEVCPINPITSCPDHKTVD